MSNSSILGFMMEALEEDLELDGEITEEEMEEVEGDAEPAVDEAAPVEEEISKLQTAIEVVENAAELASEVAEDVKESLEHGGLTAKEAYHVSKRLEAALSLTGTPGVTFSQEAFEEEGGRLAQTQYMLEGISEKLKAMWDAIKKFFVRMWEGLKNFFNLARRKAVKNAETAVKYRADLKDYKDEPKEKEVELSAGVAYNLADEKGEVIAPAQLSEKLALTSTKVLKSLTDGFTVLSGQLEDMTNMDTDADKLLKKSMDEAEKITKKKFAYFGPDKTTLVTKGETLPGNMHVIVSVKEGKFPTAKLAKVNPSLKVDAKKVQAMKKSEITTLLNSVRSGAVGAKTFVEDGGKLDKRVSEILKKGDKLAKEADKANAGSGDGIRQRMILVRQGLGSMGPAMHAAAKHMLTVQASALQYCKLSMDNLSK